MFDADVLFPAPQPLGSGRHESLAFGFPSQEEGLVLHLHLCDLNPVAVADVCRVFLDPLVNWLATGFPNVDAHLRQTAVHDALWTYAKAPHSYKPSQGDLAKYLRMAARWDLVNLLDKDALAAVQTAKLPLHLEEILLTPVNDLVTLVKKSMEIAAAIAGEGV